MKQETFARNLYKELGTKRLSERMTKQRTQRYIKTVLKYLKKTDKILDLACGYGRIAIPLKKKGYNISGVDISPNLIKDAKKEAKRLKLKIDFKIGNMKKLPYKNESFDKIICLWSAFNELTSKSGQIKAINEMYRILIPNGIAFIDLFNGESSYWKKKRLPKNRILTEYIYDVEAKEYVHTRKTLKELCKKSKFKKYQIGFKNISRRRIVLILKK